MRTKDQILDDLSKNYRTGDYWLVNFGNGWYIACQKPKHPKEFTAVEQYHVDAPSCIAGQPADITRIK